MGEHYCHLQTEDRITLYELLFKGLSIREIADAIGVHKTTVYRELQRNSGRMGYRPDLAQQAYKQRQQAKPGKLSRNPALQVLVIEKLEDSWSPELIAGYLKRKTGRCIISHETIYRFIYSPEGLKLKLYRYLIRKRKFRYPRIKRRRKMTANAREKPIEKRPDSINQRLHFGHWEGDLVLFKKTNANLITVRERKSRLVLAIKNSSRHAKSTADLLIRYMKKKLASTVKTLTLDNGVEFAEYELMENALCARVFFCEPYKSYQKGAIKNANRLLRTKLPRQIKIDDMSQSEIDNIVNALNDRPMKCLGFKTPNEVFFDRFGVQAI